MDEQDIIRIGQRLLSDVRTEHYFRTVDGIVLKNLSELVALLDTVQEVTFTHHVTHDRHDFAQWVRHSVGDEALADAIEKARSPIEVKGAILARLEHIENALMGGVYDSAVSAQVVPQARVEREEPIQEDAPARRVKEDSSRDASQENTSDDGFDFDSVLEEMERSLQSAKSEFSSVPEREDGTLASSQGSKAQRVVKDKRPFFWGDFMVGFVSGVILGVLLSAMYRILR